MLTPGTPATPAGMRVRTGRFAKLRFRAFRFAGLDLGSPPAWSPLVLPRCWFPSGFTLSFPTSLPFGSICGRGLARRWRCCLLCVRPFASLKSSGPRRRGAGLPASARLLRPLLTSRAAALQRRLFQPQARSPQVMTLTFPARRRIYVARPFGHLRLAVRSPLVSAGVACIRFLFVGPRVRYTLPPDSSSRFCPCASLHFQWPGLERTFTSWSLPMLGTLQRRRASAVRCNAWFDGPNSDASLLAPPPMAFDELLAQPAGFSPREPSSVRPGRRFPNLPAVAFHRRTRSPTSASLQKTNPCPIGGARLAAHILCSVACPSPIFRGLTLPDLIVDLRRTLCR